MKQSLIKILFVLSFAAISGCDASRGFHNKELLFQKIVEQVQAGKLTTNSGNSIQLPAEFKAASVDGELLVSRISTNQLYLIFKTWRGKGSNMEGFLFVAQPFADSEIKKDYYGQKIISIGTVDLTLEKQIGTNWYQVSYRLD